MKYHSPLRYPGGKAGLTDFLAKVIERNNLTGCPYYEPFAGGAGAALGLLNRGIVSELFLNDADMRINAFWRSALCSSDRFVSCIRDIPLTMTEWHKQREICDHPQSHPEFDVGFATFYMNRCNRSGVVACAGPIGGYEQSGLWKLDVRFNREGLAERIIMLSRMKNRIHMTCQDATDFLKKNLPHGRGRKKVFAYLDPPYVKKGQRLYMNVFKTEDHTQLADYMHSQNTLPWIMSYDDSQLIRDLYSRHKISLLPIQYSLQEKRSARELIIHPLHLSVPGACSIGKKDHVLERLDSQLISSS